VGLKDTAQGAQQVRSQPVGPARLLDCPRHDLQIDLDRLLLLLPAGHRQMVVLRFRLGLGAAEAARETGFAGGSGRQALRRSLARLRAAIGGEAAPVESPRGGVVRSEVGEGEPVANASRTGPGRHQMAARA
jgi:DNA-directed RNA polymerase specialized sigma24 family protein